MLVFVDIETTGLDPHCDYIVELGMVITDDNLRILEKQVNGDDRRAVFSAVVHNDDNSAAQMVNRMSEQVREMHEASGLIADLESGRGISEREAEDAALEFLAAFDAEGLPMTGSSVHFDRSFLESDMVRLARAFGYRNIDVSSLKELAKLWSPEVLWEPQGVKAHRAVQDILATMNELSFYRTNFLR